jgi:hypothetical protein
MIYKASIVSPQLNSTACRKPKLAVEGSKGVPHENQSIFVRLGEVSPSLVCAERIQPFPLPRILCEQQIGFSTIMAFYG